MLRVCHRKRICILSYLKYSWVNWKAYLVSYKDSKNRVSFGRLKFGIRSKILFWFLSIKSNKCENELQLWSLIYFSWSSRTAYQSLSYFSKTAYKSYETDHLELPKYYTWNKKADSCSRRLGE